jgi:hypothetical protein
MRGVRRGDPAAARRAESPRATAPACIRGGCAGASTFLELWLCFGRGLGWERWLRFGLGLRGSSWVGVRLVLRGSSWVGVWFGRSGRVRFGRSGRVVGCRRLDNRRPRGQTAGVRASSQGAARVGGISGSCGWRCGARCIGRPSEPPGSCQLAARWWSALSAHKRHPGERALCPRHNPVAHETGGFSAGCESPWRAGGRRERMWGMSSERHQPGQRT